MGTTYVFECEKCGYRTQVTGGFTEGREFKALTLHCRDCRSIIDCVIALRTTRQIQRWTPLLPTPKQAAPRLQAALDRLPSSGRRASHWRHFTPACPNDPSHRVEPWTAPGRCPRCQAYLEQGVVPFRVWD